MLMTKSSILRNLLAFLLLAVAPAHADNFSAFQTYVNTVIVPNQSQQVNAFAVNRAFNLLGSAFGAADPSTGLFNITTPFNITGVGATFSPMALNALGQINAAYTPDLLNTKQDILRVQTGPCPSTYEFDYEQTGKTEHTTNGIVSCLFSPGGTYAGTPTWPDASFLGVAVAGGNAANNKSAIPFVSYAGMLPGGFVENFNGVQANALPGAQEIDGNGVQFTHMYAFESDTNLRTMPVLAMATAAASTTTTVNVSGVSGTIAVGQAVDALSSTGAPIGVPGYPTTTVTAVSGNQITLSQAVNVAAGTTLTFRTALTGDVASFSAYFQGETNTLGNTIAYWTRGQTTARYNYNMVSDNGAANVFALIGAQGPVGPANSQGVYFKCIGGSGPLGGGGTDIFCGSLQGTADGSLQISPGSGSIQLNAATNVNSTLDVTGALYLGSPAARFAVNTSTSFAVLDFSGNIAAQYGAGADTFGANTYTWKNAAGTTTFGALSSTGLSLNGALSAASLTSASPTLLTTTTALTNGASTQTATLTNGPTAGNPTKWIPINDNGTTRYIPAW